MSREIEILHVEPTDVCQAACPACARETDSAFDKATQHHLTMSQILHHYSADQIRHMHKMFMCGVYGDPAAGKHTMAIYQEFRSINPNITLGMNTNGALQNTTWWQDLGRLFQQREDYVVFSIDGLEDTNHLYRRGVNWNKLMANAEAYISTGARAHWDMLVYKHNEHQVRACETMARQMGFSWFRVKVSRRPLVAGLQQPVHWQAPAIQAGRIDCQALAQRSAYLDARGNCWPCCWLADGTTAPIDFPSVQLSWVSDNPNPICAKTCGQQHGQNNFNLQWQREVDLDV
jgi:sulfatase maturation enzyme AslB (radical SAM superfamily)